MTETPSAPDAPREVTVLMPCLDEAETVGDCVRQALAAFERDGLDGEVLVADNGSTDRSVERARAAGARVIHVDERGYGSALMQGIEAARGRYVVMADSDGTYDFSETGRFVEKLEEGHDLVMGCRLPTGGGRIEPGAMPWTHRWIGNPLLSGIGRLFFHCPVTDFHCGMRGMRRDAIRSLNLHTTGMEFASEMVIRATLADLRIAEVPITLHCDPRTREPHLRTWHDGWRHLRFMLMCSPNWLFLIPGGTMLFLGLLGFALLLPGPLRLGGVALDFNTLLLCSLLCLVGFQSISFGILARTFAMTTGILPKDEFFRRWTSILKLEAGLLAGVGVAFAGLVLFLVVLFHWLSVGLGNLPFERGLRFVIPSVTLIAMGIQVVFFSFFLSLLGLRYHR